MPLPGIGRTAVGLYSIAIIVGALSFMPEGLGSTEVVVVNLLNMHGYPLPGRYTPYPGLPFSDIMAGCS